MFKKAKKFSEENKNSKNFLCSLLFTTSILLSPKIFSAESLSYSGRLVNANGSPVAGPVDLKVELSYSNAPATILCSQDLTNVALSNGVFHLKLDLACGASSLSDVLINVPTGEATAIRVTDVTHSKTYSFQAIHSMPFANISETAKQLVQMGAADGQFLKWNNTTKKWEPGVVSGASGGTVTNVSVTAPLAVSNGTSTPALSIGQATTSTDGYLSAADWNTFNGKQGSIAAGTTAQYYRGDKSWQTLDTSAVAENIANLYFTNARVLGVPLTGFSIGAGAITNTDTVIGAFGKVQGQLDSLNTATANYLIKNSTDSITGLVNVGTIGLLQLNYAPVGLNDAANKAYVDTKLDLTGGTLSGDLKVDTQLKLKGATNYVTLKAHATSAAYNFIFPQTAGSSSQVLTTDGAGNTSWTTPSTTATPSGAAGGDLSGTYPNPTITGLSATKIGNGDVDNTKLSYLNSVTSNVQTQLNAKEGSIAAGTAAQYYRGDKTWQTLNTSVVPENTNLYFTNARVLGVPLTGFASTNSQIAATDSVLAGFNKAQGQIDNLVSTKASLSGDTFTGDVYFNTQIKLKNGGAANYVTVKANAAGTTAYTLSLPTTAGSANQVLQTDGAGVTSWTTLSTTATPSGSAGGDLSGTYPNPTITGLAATKIGTGVVDNTEFNYLDGVTSSIQTQLNAKEGSVSAGTASQYYRGDKTWQTLDTLAVPENTRLYFTEPRVLGTVLTGFSATNSAIVATDTVLETASKAQGQINNLNTIKANVAGDTFTGDVSFNTQIKLKNGGAANYVTVKTNAAGTTAYTLSLPTTAGSANQVLQTDGAGVTSWTTPATSLPPSGSAGGDLSGTYPNPTISGLAATKIGTGVVDNTEFNYLDGVTSSIQTQLNAKEGTITAGTNLQYYRGDKTFVTLDTSVVPENGNLYFTNARAIGATITAPTLTNSVIATGDTLQVVAGKLQAQMNANTTSLATKADQTNIAQTITAATVTGLSAPVAGTDAANKTYVDSFGQWTKNGSDVYRASGNVGIGTTTPAYALDVVSSNSPAIFLANFAATGSDANGTRVLNISNSHSTTVNGSNFVVATKQFTYPLVSSGVTESGSQVGTWSGNLRNNLGTGDSGTVTTLMGQYMQYGHNNVDAAATPITTTAYGLYMSPYIKTGTITNFYDIYITADSGGGTATNRYGIYQAGNNKNYFNGSIGIGTTTPQSKLDVNGSVRVGVDATACSATIAGAMRFNTPNVEYCNGTNWLAFNNTSTGAVTSAQIADGSIVDADVNASANIAITKLGTGAVSTTEFNYLTGVTSSIQTQLNNKQPLDATLTALAAYNTNGILVQTAADTFVGRTIAGTANRLTVTNGDGVAGNPTLNLDTTFLPSPVAGDAGKFLKASGANASAWTALSSSDVTTALGFTPINKAGDTISSGTFTYNTTAVLRTLDPIGPTDVATKQYVDSYGEWIKGTGGNASDIYFNTGKVGIGTSTPAYLLSIYNGSGNSIGNIESGNNGSAVYSRYAGKTSGGTARSYIVGENISDSTGSYEIYDQTAGASRIYAAAGGNVGIGTTSPYATLNIAGSGTAVNNKGLMLGTVSDSISTAIPLNGEVGRFDISFPGWRDMEPLQVGSKISSVRMNYYSNNNALVQASELAFSTGTGSTGNNAAFHDTSGERMRINSVGYVGIGVTSPAYLLDVRNSNAVGEVHVSGTGNDDGLYLLATSNGGYVSGNTAYNGTNWVAKATTASVVTQDTNGISFYANSGLTAGSTFTPSQKMVINNNGRVGIGISSPLAVLHSKDATITGGAPATSGTADANILQRVEANTAVLDTGMLSSGAVWLQPRSRTDLSTNYNLLLNPNGGAVGIATTAPLGGIGSFTLGGTSAQGVMYIYGSTSGAYSRMMTTNGNFHIDPGFGAATGNGTYINWYSGATTNIGNGAGGYGTINAGAFTVASDRRLKRDIHTLENALDEILAMRGVEYYFALPNYTQRKQIGVIAQEIQEHYPEAVNKNKDGILTVNYPMLVAPLIEAVKGLYHKWSDDSVGIHREIASLKEENTRLNSKVNKLESENKAIEARLKRLEENLPKKK